MGVTADGCSTQSGPNGCSNPIFRGRTEGAASSVFTGRCTYVTFHADPLLSINKAAKLQCGSLSVPNAECNSIPRMAGVRLMFLNQECDMVIHKAEAEAERSGWTTRRHASYPTTDISLRNIPSLHPFASELLKTRIFPELANLYG